MLRFIVIALGLALPLTAAPRAWRNADGTRSVRAEFVSRDATSVTIRKSDRSEVTIPLEKLHAGDRDWLATHHALPAPPPPAVLDTLRFGDSRAEVTAKLIESKLFKLTIAETMLGRTGLNGVFRTEQSFAGLPASLFFDWDESGGLSEISLQTDGRPAKALEPTLAPCRNAFIELLTTLHGKPVHANPELDLASIADGNMTGTHVWKLVSGGSVMLGTAREDSNYQIVVRFTTEEIEPVRITSSDPKPGRG